MQHRIPDDPFANGLKNDPIVRYPPENRPQTIACVKQNIGSPFAFFSSETDSSSAWHAFKKKLFLLGEEILGVNGVAATGATFRTEENAKKTSAITLEGLSNSVQESDLNHSPPCLEVSDQDRDHRKKKNFSPFSLLSSSSNGVPVEEGGKGRDKSTETMNCTEEGVEGDYFHYPVHQYTLLLAHRDAPYLSTVFSPPKQNNGLKGRKRSRSQLPSSQLRKE